MPRARGVGARFLGLVLVAGGVLAGCPSMTPKLPAGLGRASAKGDPIVPAPCAGLDADGCARARGILAAASALSNVRHEYILDPTSSFAAGRGLERTGSGLWNAVPTACAQPAAAQTGGGDVDAAVIDYGFVGIAIDTTLVGADVDLMPYLSAGGSVGLHKLRLVAIAFVRDKDPQFFEAAGAVEYASAACACGRATHFIGAVKMGGMLSYEMDARAGEVHGRALDFVRAQLAAADAHVSEIRVGGLEVAGLDAMLGAAADPAGSRGSHMLDFRVSAPVPIAYDVYPLSDVCKFALPEPEVTPVPVDFGEVPYGRSATRLVHVVNRAAIDLTASFNGNSFGVPARGSADLVATWTPSGDVVGCDVQDREESIVFAPSDSGVPVTPKQQTVNVVEHVRSGSATNPQRVHVDTGTHVRPDYDGTARDLACPPDYVLAACKTENAACGDGASACTSSGYALTATPTASGCHFACAGPSAWIWPSSSCRFDGVMECRLRCAR